LKAVVPTFAKLLAITDIRVDWAVKPVLATHIEASILLSSFNLFA